MSFLRALVSALIILESASLLAAPSYPPPEMQTPGKRTVNVLLPDMVRIPGGSYVVGWDKDENRLVRAWPRYREPMSDLAKMLTFQDFPVDDRQVGKAIRKYELDGLPTTRTVSVKPFLIGKYEVTRLEFRRYCEESGNRLPVWKWRPNDDYYPANNLTCTEAEGYCRWLAKKTERPFRLPTSDEWEIAAQGPERWTFPWGNEFPERFSDRMVELFVKKPNAYGIYHMGWFVGEWCRDGGWAVRGGFLGQGEVNDDIFLCAFGMRGSEDQRWDPFGFRLAADVTKETGRE